MIEVTTSRASEIAGTRPRRISTLGMAPGPLFVVMHVPLALLMARVPLLATAHALGVVLVAGICALGARRIETVAWVAAYVAACDVLWRMAEARFFHEGAKYLLSALLLVALFRLFRSWRDVGLPALYLAAFMPAVVLSFLVLGVEGGARELVSANLSGPIALAVSVVFFSQIRSSVAAVRPVLWALLAPITAIASIAADATGAAGSIEFKNASNFATSAGFGPNQVSAILGLGVLACLLLALTETFRRAQLFEIGLGLGLLTQGLLTFSRGGVVNLFVAVVVAAVFLARSAARAGRFLAIGTVFVAVLAWALVPRLDVFTDGAFGERYTSFDTTNRTSLAERDLEVFGERPLTGVGAGVGSQFRTTSTGERIAAHTEFTRMLAEQGVLGGLGIVALVAIVLRAIRRAQPGLARALAAGLGAWSLAVMTNAAMRIATISFVFGLAVLASHLERDEVEAGADA